MKRFMLFVLILLLFSMGMAGCDPSEEEIAAMTQAAASPTPIPPTATPQPTPTFTPTPLPYDLSVKVVNEAGEPVAGASVVFTGMDYQDAEKVSDESGLITWTNLPDENASFSVNASGYYATDSEMTVQNGPNEVTVTLQADPRACCPLLPAWPARNRS